MHEHARAMDRAVAVAGLNFLYGSSPGYPSVELVARQQEIPCREEVLWILALSQIARIFCPAR